MTTRRDLIIDKYKKLEEELKTVITDDIFPDIETIDLADIIFLLTFIFLGIDTVGEYERKIDEIMESKNIVTTDENRRLMFPKIIKFICWLKNLE